MRCIEIALAGEITLEQLREALESVEEIMSQRLRDAPHSILIDALKASRYEPAAREWFAAKWAPRNKHRVRKMAIVSKEIILRMAATTIGVRVGYRINAFGNREKALAWLEKK